MHRFGKIISIFLLFNVLVACATETTFLEDFSHMRLGMDKDATIEHLGSPSRKEFHDDKDWWYYKSYDEGKLIEKMVVFKNNKLIYAGKVASVTGSKGAEEEDKVNAQREETLESERERARVNSVPMNSGPSGIKDDTPH